MGLLGNQLGTVEQQKAAMVDREIINAFGALQSALQRSVMHIYGKPEHTQGVLDAWGTGAVLRFQLSNIAFAAINAAIAATGEGTPLTGVIPPTHTVVINPDGTATDTYTPAAEPETN